MKTSRKGMLMAALICGTVAPVLFSGSAYAAEKEDVDAALQSFELNPMVITAQRTETKDLDTPASTTVVTKEEILKTGATTAVEALRRVPGITDYSYGPYGDDVGSSYSRVYLRGLDKGALVLVNGAPININNYASPNAIPIDAIEKIEVVKGANSVLYGAEALGGVINIITKKGEGKVSTTLSGTVGNYVKKYSASIQGDGVIMSFGKDYLNDYEPSQMKRKSANSFRSNDKYQRTNAFASFALSPDLQFTWNYSKINPQYGTKNLNTKQYTGTKYFYKDIKNTGSLVYTDKVHQIKSILSYNSKKVTSTGYKFSDKTTSHSATSNYTASNIYFDTQKKWDFGKADSLIFGINAKHEKYDQATADNMDNSRNSYGTYLSYNKHFNDRFNATLGLRAETYRSTDFDSKNHNVFLPQLQTLYKIKDNLSWYVNIGKSFEMPAINSHTSAGGGTSNQIRLRNDVKPEEGWTYETGIKRITDSSATKLAVFNMNYKNKFVWVPDPSDATGTRKMQENTDKFKNTGVELEYQKKLSNKWDYNFGITWQNPKSYDKIFDLWLRESARFQLSAGVNYTLNKFSTNLNCLVLTNRENSSYHYDGSSATGSKPSKPGGKVKLPSPDHSLKNRFLLNASFTYRPTENQYVTLNLNNILDRKEPVGPYEYYDLPFNWMLTYNYTF